MSPAPDETSQAAPASEKPLSPANKMPTPEPSSDSPSDGDPSSDSTVPEPEPAVVVDVSKTRSRSSTKTSNDGIRRLSASKMQELTAAPESLPVATISERHGFELPLSAGIVESSNKVPMADKLQPSHQGLSLLADQPDFLQSDIVARADGARAYQGRPAAGPRTLSTPPTSRRKSTSQPPSRGSSTRRNSFHPVPKPLHLDAEKKPTLSSTAVPPPKDDADPRPPSPIPPSIPLPPMSIPTLLQLELAGQRPSPLYIHHSYTSDIPYESSAVKFERLKNFLLLPGFLERTMTFGILACLDAWLWTFTVLPIRFCIAASVLVRWWGYLLGKEARWVLGFVWYGLGRMWMRGRRGRSVSSSSHQSSIRGDGSRSRSAVREPVPDASAKPENVPRRLETPRLNINPTPHRRSEGRGRHRRTKSSPSDLNSFHKADLLQGAILVCSSIALMGLDASRMYHFIRAQSTIKLYAIYNLLEVGDRLLSALGQDIFECLFSTETLSRNSSGRSKVMLPLGMFFLALFYNTLHAIILFYQVIALNVAVNAYSNNVLLTLLLSNQFVEIKSAVFKRFEKENTFQLACADIVERFQLWIMLLIICMRNIVEVGSLFAPGAWSEDSGPSGFPLHTPSILPASFTLMPSWLWSGDVLTPFIVVIGSEVIVDWIKHAYVGKFNNIKPTFYSRILDILCKDYYTNVSL